MGFFSAQLLKASCCVRELCYVCSAVQFAVTFKDNCRVDVTLCDLAWTMTIFDEICVSETAKRKKQIE